MKQEIMKALTKTGNLLAKNSPHIFTGLAVAGVVGTIALVIRAQFKADIIVEEEENNRINSVEEEDQEYKPVTFKERVKLTWKEYVPSAVSGATTIGFMIAADRVQSKRLAAISALYAASQEAYKEFRNNTEKFIGSKEFKKLGEKSIEEKMAKNPVDRTIPTRTGNGDTLCFDVLSGRYFYSSINYIESAVNDFNQRLLVDNQLSLNEWYDYLGLDNIRLGDEVGFNNMELLKINRLSKLASDGTPCFVLDYYTEPKVTYRDW